ncbi:MAG: ABC transporter substrate-binding protein [Myxococcales bacterium]
MHTFLLRLTLVCAAIPVAARAETPKDTVVMAKPIDDMISLDPAESFEFSGSELVDNLYDRLIGYDVKDVEKLFGELATNWSVAADGRTYTFKMRPNVKFHSGNPVTAEDAAFSYQRAVILNKTPAFILTQLGFTPQNAAQRIRALDPGTLVIETEKAFAPSFVYYALTSVVGSVVDSKLVKEHVKGDDLGNEWLKTNEAGSGPFKLRSWRPNESYTLDSNPQWYRGAPKIKRLVARHVVEPATQRLLLEKGDIDYARSLTKDQLDSISRNKDLAIDQGNKGSILYVGLNQRNPILAKPEVREALKWLVDYDAIEKNILSGRFVKHETFLPRGFLGAIGDTPYKLDVNKAKALLARAGYPNGFSLTLDVESASPFTDVAQALQATWALAGVKASLVASDGKQLLTKYRARNHEAVIYRWGPDYQDPHTNAEAFAMNYDNRDDAKSKTVAWRNTWDIPEFTRRAGDAVLERDTKKRAAAYEQLQRDHLKVAPFVILFQEIEVAARRKNVDGFIIGPNFGTNFYYAISKK